MKDDARKWSPQEQAAARKRALDLSQKGWRNVKIAEALGVTARTVSFWKTYQRRHGRAALLADERGRPIGSGRTLKEEQEAHVRKCIADKMPDQLKLPFALWSRKAVVELIARLYGIKLSVRTMGKYLKRWGFTPQKPIKRAYEQNPKAVEKWLKESYPAIAAAAKAEGAEIYWGDQTGVNNQPNAPRGYAPCGQTPVIKQRAKRFGCSVMSAITNRGSARWMVYKGALNAALLIRFMKRLVKQMGGRKVYLILDNLKVHHAKPVKAWLEANVEQIAVHYLPSYSPELNPDERLNRSLKSKLGHQPAARDEAALQRQVLGALRSTHKQPQRIRSFFDSVTTQYAA